ncbi:hypothetical protein TNCV_1127091 [Trichonephila clavipes]|nr:hypothetical protein TNCV_1127091 [Trichonephila clavipes]
MINRSRRGHSYSDARGEILGPSEDAPLRKHLPRMFPLTKNESAPGSSSGKPEFRLRGNGLTSTAFTLTMDAVPDRFLSANERSCVTEPLH